MSRLRDVPGWERARQDLDGDREASALLVLHERRVRVREEALAAMKRGRELLSELEDQVRELDEGMRDLEQRAVEMAEARKRVRATRAELEATVREAVERVRKENRAKPGPPVPVDRLVPGFAVQTRATTTELPGAGRLPGAGVRNARGVAQAMIARLEKNRQERG